MFGCVNILLVAEVAVVLPEEGGGRDGGEGQDGGPLRMIAFLEQDGGPLS